MGYRETVLKIAKSQIGQCEPTQDDKYIKWYNQTENTSFAMNVSWCAIFASWVLRQAKVDESLMPNFASCSVAIKWAKRQKLWYSRLTNYSPTPGVLVFFDWDGDSVQDHVGIVTAVTTNNITTIEGNSSNKVQEKVYAKTSKHILGYIDIQYPEATTATYATIKDAQTYMKSTYGVTVTADGIWGPKSKKAMIMCVQKELNKSHGAHLTVDGIFGSASKSSFPVLKSGAKGALVTLVQYCLVASGAKIAADGQYGAKTAAAVKSFQAAKKITADGAVGATTMTYLLR